MTARSTAGQARRSIVAAWERVRPFPTPRYPVLPPPTAGGDPTNPLDPFLPPTIQTIGDAALSHEAADGVLATLDRLTSSEFHDGQQLYMRWGRQKYGEHWRLANLHTVLWAATTLLKPQAYLEIGVQRGRSAAIVGALAPQCAIYGFDLWLEGYAGTDNPGPDFVRNELRAAGHTGEVSLVSGDSKTTVPAFLREYAALHFDIISIDGDKSLAGIARDFAHTLPRLKIGGIVIFDDMPAKPVLRRVWQRVVCDDSRYAQWEFNAGEHGVAAAIRVR